MSSNSLIKVLSQCEISPAFIADLDIHPLLVVVHGYLQGVVLLVFIDVHVQLLHTNALQSLVPLVCTRSIRWQTADQVNI